MKTKSMQRDRLVIALFVLLVAVMCCLMWRAMQQHDAWMRQNAPCMVKGEEARCRDSADTAQ